MLILFIRLYIFLLIYYIMLRLANTNGSLDSVSFVTPPTCSVDPTTDNDLANKKYVDDSVDAINVANSTFSQPILQIMLNSNGSNKSNTALGENTLTNYYSNTSIENNTAVGKNALQLNTNSYNTAVGAYALANNTSGWKNSAFGDSSLQANTTGNNNTGFGKNTLLANSQESDNTAVGQNAGFNTFRGGQNTIVGAEALSNTAGGGNVAIGYNAGNNSRGNNNWVNSNNTFLGRNSDLNSSNNNWSNSTAIGANSKITASNQIVLGTSSETVVIPKFTTTGVVHNSANGDLTSSLIIATDISNDAITSEKILNGTILGTDISSNTITANNIANGTITSAKLASDLSLSGNPTTTTQSSSDDSTRIATTAYVKSQNYVTSSSIGVMPVTEPSSPVNGSFWFNPATGNLRIYYGGFWRDFGPLT